MYDRWIGRPDLSTARAVGRHAERDVDLGISKIDQ